MKWLLSLGGAGICAVVLANVGWAQAPCQPPNLYHGPFMPYSPNQGPNCAPPWTLPSLPPAQGMPGTPPSTTEGTPGQPGTGQPGTGQPGTGQPGTGQQGTGDQNTNQQGQNQNQNQNQNDNAQTQPTERGGEVAGNYDGPMFGDLIVPATSFQSSVSPQLLSRLGSQGAAPASTGARAIGGGGGQAGATFPFHSAIKIGENELPKPVDRVYVTYNYYSDVTASGLANGIGTGAQVNRQLFGGEKTFLSGNASVGIRLPVFQTFGTNTVASYQLGETSLIFKYALYNNRQTGDVFTAGMVFSFPTGRSLDVPGQSSVNSTYFQPWMGGIFHIENLYFLDFTSLAVPTDSRDISFFFEDFAIGYLIYRNTDRSAFLKGIVPDAEFHVNIPLNHQSLTSVPIGFPNTVDFTGGCLLFLGRSVLGLAAGTPMTGPRPYSFEAIASLNYFF